MSQSTEAVLNRVLIDMGRSFLQYIADAWPWVDPLAQTIQDQVMVISARQRQDISDIVDLLTEREYVPDFGSFPTEYTDLQFLALDSIFKSLHKSQAVVCQSIAQALTEVRQAGDVQAAELLEVVEMRQKEAAAALRELHAELNHKPSAAS